MTNDAHKTDSKPTCPKCGNRLRILPDQLGQSVRCPKCNATFIVGGRQDAVAAESAAPPSEDDAYEPIIPLPRATMFAEEHVEKLDPTAGETVYDVDWATADDMEMEAPVERPAPPKEEYLEAARARGLIREQHFVDPPQWTFFSGVFTYPWRGINLTRWTGMAFGLAIVGAMLITALEWLGFLGGEANMILGILLTLFTILLSLVVLSFAAASCHAAIQDTANGHDLPLESSMPDWDMWVFSLVCWICVWAASAAVGFPLSLAIGPAAFLLTGTLLFPVLLLSAMECESYMLPYSPPVLRTLGYFFHGWIAFQAITLAMIAGWIVAFDFGFRHAPYLTVLASGPVLATIMLLYARLLGRLAWRASGAPPARVDADDANAQKGPGGRAKVASKRKKRASIKIVIPDEFDRDSGPTQAPPRINFHHR